jgi:hypothetical protein
VTRTGGPVAAAGASLAARPTPWWLWPNVLALDAPAVAVAWQTFLAHAFAAPVPPAAPAVLGLVVWGVYLADRRLDARAGHAAQPRHRFAAAHPTAVAAVAAVALLAAAALALTLPTPYLVAGGAVAACVGGYFVLVHAVPRSPGGKERLVGLLFAAGVAVPLAASAADPVGWLPAVGGFALLCWLNCRLIDHWEGDAAGTLPAVLLAAPVVACAAFAPPAVGVALAASAGLLLLLHGSRRRTGPRLARVLADVALLTPLPAWLLP